MNLLKNNAIFIVGPTASGKTYLAHKIFTNFNISLISMDSMQIYKGMNIGTSKPTKEEIEKYEYYGIDIVDPDVHFSTGDYLRYCKKIVSKIYNENKLPLFVGGTGLYFDSLTKGFDNIPEADFGIRKKLEDKLEKYGIEFLYNELFKVDKIYASKIAKNDKKRIVRALEVYYITSKPFSSFHKKKLFDRKDVKYYNSVLNCKYNILKIGIYLPREILYKKINKRVDLMIKRGFVEEALSLYNKYKGVDSPAFKAIGYSHLFRYFKNLSKDKNLNQVINQIKRDTRRYAKRQLTWFKRDSEIIWFNMENIDKNIDKILKTVKRYISC